MAGEHHPMDDFCGSEFWVIMPHNFEYLLIFLNKNLPRQFVYAIFHSTQLIHSINATIFDSAYLCHTTKMSYFQNVNTTWYTENPDLTVCFQRTVLVWTPCAILWGFALLDLFYIKKAMNRNIPWGVLNVSKLIITGALILLTVVDLCMAARHNSEGKIYRVDFYTPVIKIVSFVSQHFVRLSNCRWF